MFLKYALLAAASVTLCSAMLLPTALDEKPIRIGDRVDPDITLKDIDGKAWRLGDFQKTDEREGQVVVLDFWSINCPVSVRYEERMKKLHAFCEKKGVKFLAVNANHTEVDADAEDPYARIKKYVAKAEVKFPILIDRGNAIADRLSAETTPHLFIIDAEGKLRYQGALDDDSNGKKEKAGEPIQTYAVDAIQALLRGEAPAQSSTKAVGCSIKRVKKAAQ